VAAKGEINKANDVAAGPDSLSQTTFYTVLSHPDPMPDPTGDGGAAPMIAISRDAENLRIEFSGTLESTTSLPPANWQPVAGATSPHLIQPAQLGAQQFFRARE
jgi:hypothetical protein